MNDCLFCRIIAGEIPSTKVYENEYEGVQYVADNIVKAIRMYNEIHCSNEVYEESQPFVLGLTTGRTPLGLYRELVKRHHEGQISFRNVAVYSLDEFYPIRSTEQQSRNYRIHEEFSSNANNSHEDGALAMARSADPNSAGSQFYFCLGPQHGLDSGYTVFGQTVEGMDVISQLRVGDVINSIRIEHAQA